MEIASVSKEESLAENVGGPSILKMYVKINRFKSWRMRIAIYSTRLSVYRLKLNDTTTTPEKNGIVEVFSGMCDWN